MENTHGAMNGTVHAKGIPPLPLRYYMSRIGNLFPFATFTGGRGMLPAIHGSFTYVVVPAMSPYLPRRSIGSYPGTWCSMLDLDITPYTSGASGYLYLWHVHTVLGLSQESHHSGIAIETMAGCVPGNDA